MYREGVDSCEPVFIRNEVKKSEALKRKGCVIVGGASKRVKKAEVGVVATRSQPEISADDVVATVGVLEDVEDVVV